MSVLRRAPRRLLMAPAMFLAVVAVVLALVAYAGRPTDSNGQSGEIHLTKECTRATGLANSFCTILSSNVDIIKGHPSVVYLQANTNAGLNSDFVLAVSPGNVANGHCELPRVGSGVCTFTGGTGDFARFRATLKVTSDPNIDQGWKWDGTYRFAP